MCEMNGPKKKQVKRRRENGMKGKESCQNWNLILGPPDNAWQPIMYICIFVHDVNA